jgi:hypothetical protein
MSNESQETKAALSPANAETLAMWDAKILEAENFLKHNPDPRLASGGREILAELRGKRASFLWDVEHPAPAPPPPPPPELIKKINEAVLAAMPDIVSRVIVELQKK